MTLFEYLAIAFSLVLSFSAMRLVAGLPYAAQPNRRYWVHLSFVCILLLVTAVAFWNLWNYRDAMWTLPRFLLILATPGLIYFEACTLIPEQASTIAKKATELTESSNVTIGQLGTAADEIGKVIEVIQDIAEQIPDSRRTGQRCHGRRLSRLRPSPRA